MIKFYFILIFFVGQYGFAERPYKNILTPTKNIHTGVTIHKRTNYFIDIEAPVHLVWVGCSTTNPKKATSYFGAEVADGDILYSFIPRRAVYDVPMCLEEEKKYHDIMKGAKTVRLVGTDTDVSPKPHSPHFDKDERAPRNIINKPKRVVVFFERLQVGEKCRSYFSNYCDLPKNYWAGTIPVE